MIRPSRRFNALRVPKKLQAELPYASKPKLTRPATGKTYLQKRAVVLEPEEKRALTLMQEMRALTKDKAAKRHEKQESRRVEHRKKVAKEDAKKGEKREDERKKHMRIVGQKQKRETDMEDGKGRKRRKS